MNHHATALPPALSGWPLIGNLIEFQRDRSGLLRRGYETHGPIFSVRLGPKRFVVLVGSDYHGFFFKETDKLLSIGKAYEFIAATFGKIAVAADPAEYVRQRPVLQKPFRSENLPSQVTIMAEETSAWLDTLGDTGEIEIVAAVERLTQYIAAHCLMGRDFRFRVGDEFLSQYRDLALGLEPVLPPNLPLPRFRRRDRAKRQLQAMIRSVIAERKKSGEAHDDFLQDFIDAHYADGAAVEDQMVVDMILMLTFAGHETTSGQAAWSLIQLLQHPDYLRRAQEEMDRIWPKDRPLDKEILRSLDHLLWALKETERLHPSADILLRYNLEAYEIGGYHVPKGWYTMISPKLAHLLPEIYADPEEYDPLRFGPGREEDRKHPYARIGFGGGVHKCAGMHFAYYEMMVLIASMLRRFDLDLVSKNPVDVYGKGTFRPSPTWIRYQRKLAS